MRFDDAFLTNAICVPPRAVLLTGLRIRTTVVLADQGQVKADALEVLYALAFVQPNGDTLMAFKQPLPRRRRAPEGVPAVALKGAHSIQTAASWRDSAELREQIGS